MEITLLCSDPEERAALLGDLAGRVPLRPGDETLAGAAEWIWWHEGATPAHGGAVERERGIALRIREHLERGSRVLVSGAVARHVDLLADEPRVPVLLAREGHSELRAPEPACAARGLCALPGEPLFARSGTLVLLSSRRRHAAFRGAIYRGGTLPAKGKLLAVAAGARRVHAADGALWTHRLGRGRLLSLGAHLVFAEQLEHREARARFCGDLVDWLCNDAAQRRTRGWPGDPTAPTFSVDVRAKLPRAPVLPAIGEARGHELAAGVGRFDLRSGDGLLAAGDPFGTALAEFAECGSAPGLGLALRFAVVRDGRRSEGCREEDPGVVRRAWLGPERLERELGWGELSLAQRVSAEERGFRCALRNTGALPVRVEFELVARPGRAFELPGAPSGDLEVAVTGDGEVFRARDRVRRTTWSAALDRSPRLRGTFLESRTARCVREIEIAPGEACELRVESSRDGTAPRTEVPLPRTRLALSGHDPEFDRLLSWLVARVARDAAEARTCLFLGDATPLARWPSEAGSALALALDAAAFGVSQAALPDAWPRARRVLAEALRSGTTLPEATSWAAAARLAAGAGDAALARLCAAEAATGTRPEAPVPRLVVPTFDQLSRATVGPLAERALAAWLATALGIRIVRDRLEVEVAPVATEWRDLAFAGLVLGACELAGELHWDAEGRALELTLLASADREAAAVLELELAPELRGHESVVVVRDGVPLPCSVEQLDGAVRPRVRCRITGATELSFTRV